MNTLIEKLKRDFEQLRGTWTPEYEDWQLVADDIVALTVAVRQRAPQVRHGFIHRQRLRFLDIEPWRPGNRLRPIRPH